VRETFDISRPIWIEVHKGNVHKHYSVAMSVVSCGSHNALKGDARMYLPVLGAGKAALFLWT
jgi:hypothetical protein